MGIVNKEEALYLATGVDTTGLKQGKEEILTVLKSLADEAGTMDLFSGVSMAAAAAFTQAAAGVYGFSEAFGQTMQQIAAISPEMTAQIEGWEQQLLGLLQQVPVKADDCARAFYQIVVAGQEGAEAMRLLEEAAREAVSSGESVTSAYDRISAGGGESQPLPEVDWQKLISSTDAQVQLLQNRLLALLQPLGKKVMKEVSGVASGLGEALANGEIISSLDDLNTLATVAARAITEYKEALGEATEAVTAEGVAMEMATGIREAWQGLVAEGLALQQEELAGQLAWQQVQVDSAAVEQQSAETQANLLNDGKSLAAMIDAEIARIQQKKEGLSDLADAQQIGLELAREELTEATGKRTSLEDEYKLIDEVGQQELARAKAVEISKAVQVESAAVEKVGNAERALTNTQLQLQRVNQQNTTAATLTGNMATQGAAAANTVAATSTTLLGRAQQYATLATRSLTAAIAANPLGMVLTVVSMAISAFSAFGRETRNVTSDQEQLNEALDKQREEMGGLVNTLYDENEADVKRAEALLKLREMNPQVWNKVDLANLAEQNRNKLLREQNNLLEEQRELELERAAARSEARMKELQQDADDAIYKPFIQDADDNSKSGTRDYYLSILERERKKYEGINDQLNHIRSVKEAIAELSMTKEEKLEAYTAQLGELQEKLKGINLQLKLSGKTENTSYIPDIYAGSSDVSRQQNETEVEIAEMAGKIKQLNAGKELSKGEINERSRIEKELTDMVTKMRLKRELDSKKGLERELVAIDQEYKAKLDKVEEQEKKLQASYAIDKKEMPGEQKKQLQTLKEGYGTEKEEKSKKAKEDWEKKAKEEQAKNEAEVEEHTKNQTNMFLAAEAQKLDAIRERYDKEREWAKDQNINHGMPDKKYDDYLKTLNINQAKETQAVLTEGLKNYALELEQLEAAWQAKIDAVQGDEQLKMTLTLEKDKAVSALKADEIVNSEDWLTLFGELDTLTVTQIDQLIATIESKLRDKDLKLEPIDTKALLANLNQAKQKVIEVNPFHGLANSFQDVFKKGAKTSDESTQQIKEKWQNLGTSTQGCFDFVNDAVGGCEALSDLLGDAGQESMQMIQGVAMAGIAMGTAIDTMESGSVILAAISAALTVVNVLVSVFNKDKKKEKKIQSLQVEVDKLERAYDKLGEAIERTYSEEVFNRMDEQNDNLREQQALIQQQILLEEKKKKTDKGKIREWQNQLEDIDAQIEDNQRKRIEMLAGTDVKSAIDEFADALVEAYAKGEDGAVALADTTKKVMANAVKEALKRKFLGDEISKAVTELGNSMEDGKLTEREKQNFQQAVTAAGERFSEAMKAYDDLFHDEAGLNGNGVTGELQAAMTEGTASQLVGLWNMTATDIRSMRNLTSEQVMLCSSMNLNVNEVLRQQYLIEANTRRTAENTSGTLEEVKAGFTRLDTRLQKIDSNTQGYTGRGK